MKKTESSIDLPSLVQRFFCEYLLNQRRVSPATISSYRDTFRLFLRFNEQLLGKDSSSLQLKDLDAPQIVAFLDYLENKRGNSVRSRNVRLAAIRSFLKYAALQDPTALSVARRVLAIPQKRFDRPSLDYLSHDEITVILNAPDTTTWSGHRDRVMLLSFYNTGARVSEITGLNVDDFQSSGCGKLLLHGKGRKERVIPLWKNTNQELRDWLLRIDNTPGRPLFPNRRGERLSRSGVRARLRAALKIAAKTCRTLENHRVSPHLLRHTTAMHLLQSGTEMTVIALWLGHEGTSTTHIYVEADLEMKKRAINKINKPGRSRRIYQPSNRLLAFLEAL